MPSSMVSTTTEDLECVLMCAQLDGIILSIICSDEGTMDLCIVYNWHTKQTNVVPFLFDRALYWLGHTCQGSNWVIAVISSQLTTRLPEGLDGFFP